MRTIAIKIIAVIALWLVGGMPLTSCDDDSPPVAFHPNGTDRVETLSSGIVIQRFNENRLYFLKGNVTAPTFELLFECAENEKIAWFTTGPNPDNPSQVFVLTQSDDPRKGGSKGRLHRVTTNGKAPTVYSLGALFDQIMFGPSGQMAVLYHSANPMEQEGFFNPNEVALINLGLKSQAGNPNSFTPPLEGAKIDNVVFIPRIRVGGVDRQVLVFMAGIIITVHDLSAPDSIWAKGPIGQSGSGKVTAVQAVPLDETPGCTEKTCEARIYIRANGTEDISYLSLGHDPAKFTSAEVHLQEAGGTPMDIAVVSDGARTYLAILSAVSPGSQLVFVDTLTSKSFSIVSDEAFTRAQPVVEEGLNKLVLYGKNAPLVRFLEMNTIVENGDRNAKEIDVPGTASQIVELEDNRLLMIPRSGSSFASDLIIVDIANETSEMVSSSGTYNWSEAQILNNNFYLVPNDDDRIDMLNLTNGSTRVLYLDDPIVSLHLIQGTKSAIAYHNAPSGRATLFPLSKPTRENAWVLDGLWLKGALNEEGE